MMCYFFNKPNNVPCFCLALLHSLPFAWNLFNVRYTHIHTYIQDECSFFWN
jgi:hypothetical protein